MKVGIVHITDIHCTAEGNIREIVDYDRLVQAILSCVRGIDKCIFVVSGDVAFQGKSNEYDVARTLMVSLVNAVKQELGTIVEVLYVPGNHDIDYKKHGLEEKIIESRDSNGVIGRQLATDDYCRLYIKSMNPFFIFSRNAGCIWDKKLYKDIVIQCGDKSIGFILLNTAPFSLLSNHGNDKGNHLIMPEQYKAICKATTADYNVLVMHHSLEWFDEKSKGDIIKVLAKRYNMCIFGHEHSEIAEQRSTNTIGTCFYQQGYALIDSYSKENGFCFITIDLGSQEYDANAFIRKHNVYKHKNLLNGSLKKRPPKEIGMQEEYYNSLEKNQYGIPYDDYYVFPGLKYSIISEKERVAKRKIDTEDDFFDFIENHNLIHIAGESKYGKTLMTKRLCKKLYIDNYLPLMFDENSYLKNENKIIEYAFNDQYEYDNNEYEMFLQLPKEEKVAIIDNADRFKESGLNKLITILLDTFGKIVVVHKEKIELDVEKQVKESLRDKVELTIQPLLYKKRLELIRKTLASYYPEESLHVSAVDINIFFNSQIKFIHLYPEFVIDFTKQFVEASITGAPSGKLAFSMVYENSIRDKVVSFTSPESAMNILGEIAYYMHFKKMPQIKQEVINSIIYEYNKSYRQTINITEFVKTVTSVGILRTKENSYAFSDRTMLSYFVARAINRKANGDIDDCEYIDAKEKFAWILDNLCFGNNSDIVLFLSLITENTRFIRIIIEKAIEHFSKYNEFNIEDNNIAFLSNADVRTEDSLPNEKDKERHEKQLSVNEEATIENNKIELIDDYDYDEADVTKYYNQLLISISYIEIIIKALPAFCANLKVQQQDELADLVYSAPNKFIYLLLHDIDQRFNDIVEMLYDDAKTRGSSITKEGVKNVFTQIAGMMVMELYDRVGLISTSKSSFITLNQEKYQNGNLNYKIQNLLINSNYVGPKQFSPMAIELDKTTEDKFAKGIIRDGVYKYFIRREDVQIKHESESLAQYFFGNKRKNELKRDKEIRKLEHHSTRKE